MPVWALGGLRPNSPELYEDLVVQLNGFNARVGFGWFET